MLHKFTLSKILLSNFGIPRDFLAAVLWSFSSWLNQSTDCYGKPVFNIQFLPSAVTCLHLQTLKFLQTSPIVSIKTLFYSQPFKFVLKHLYRCCKRNGIYHKANRMWWTAGITHTSTYSCRDSFEFYQFFSKWSIAAVFVIALSLKYEKYCHKYTNKLKWFDESTSKYSLEMASLLNDLTDFDLTAYRFELCCW